MKLRICPECGKHNPVSIWNCSNCGQTLSVDTIVESDNPLVELDTEILDSGDDEQELSVSSASPRVAPATGQLLEPSTPSTLEARSNRWPCGKQLKISAAQPQLAPDQAERARKRRFCG